ncbi:hypothetical protein R1sor_018510 [Riccia sorocarpa]|uniref:Cyclin-like domain-containing protein n=1 Tax=Riccia sorocarpa TaxID=122646 RepID=A0ABD3I9Z9_9MARC
MHSTYYDREGGVSVVGPKHGKEGGRREQTTKAKESENANEKKIGNASGADAGGGPEWWGTQTIVVAFLEVAFTRRKWFSAPRDRQDRETMGRAWCPYCAGPEWRYVAVGEGRFNMECKTCLRVVEERHSKVEEIFVERAYDAPLCIVTPDCADEVFKVPPLDDDPFENIGFISTFSTWSIERSPLYGTTTSSMSGQLAEMERLLVDALTNDATTSASGTANSSQDMVRGYLQILEVGSILRLERDSCDHAVELFRQCLQTTYLRNRNIEALATAAVVQAMREAGEPRTLQEVAQAASIPQKEIGRHMKLLSDALKLSQPMNSNSISVHMPRFCSILQLSQSTQKLATHIGEVVLDKSFCTRRNPVSISAAAIYLACHLEDKRKTQTEICKATGLTEVTLRKVYKELMENLEDLLPPDYTPAVPLEKAFSVNTASSLRVHVQRQACGVSGLSDPSMTATPYNSALSNNSAGMVGDTSSAIGGSGASSPAQPSLVRIPVSTTSANDRLTVMSYRGSTPPTEGGRAAAMHVFAVPSQVPSMNNGCAESVGRNRRDVVTEGERQQGDGEKERDRERSESEYRERKKQHRETSMMPPASVPFRQPHFFPFPVDPRVLQEMWPLHVFNAAASMRSEEATVAAARAMDKSSREDGMPSPAPQPNGKVHPQYVGVFPGMPENPSMQQLKLLQLVGSRPTDSNDRQGGFDRDRDVPRDRDHGAAQMGEFPGTSGSTPATSSSIASTAFGAGSTSSAAPSGRPAVFPGFPPGLWPFMNNGAAGPYGLFSPQLLAAAGGSISQSQGHPQGHPQGGGNNAGAGDKPMGTNMGLDGRPQGPLVSTGVEGGRMARIGRSLVPGQSSGQPPGLLGSAAGADAMGRMGPGMLSGQNGQSNVLWPGPQFHQLFLSQGMIPGSLPTGAVVSNGPSEGGSTGVRRENVGGMIDVNGRPSSTGPNVHQTHRPVTDLFPMLGAGTNRSLHGPPPGHGSATPSRTEKNETKSASGALPVSQSTYERHQPLG